MKKHRWCAWDSNPGRQDGRHRRIHWAMAAPLREKIRCDVPTTNSMMLHTQRRSQYQVQTQGGWRSLTFHLKYFGGYHKLSTRASQLMKHNMAQNKCNFRDNHRHLREIDWSLAVDGRPGAGAECGGKWMPCPADDKTTTTVNKGRLMSTLLLLDVYGDIQSWKIRLPWSSTLKWGTLLQVWQTEINDN